MEGLRISQEGDNSVALVNGGIYYHENLVKTILENYNKSYEYSENKIDITTNIDDSSFLVSKAEIYEIDGSVSMSSRIRQDINGNEFSGILFSGNGKASVLLNEKYTKIKGIVHVAKESINDRDCRVIIYKTDKYGNTTQVHESKDLTKLSGIDDFSNGCDIEGAVVLTIEKFWKSLWRLYGCSNKKDAYLYNDCLYNIEKRPQEMPKAWRVVFLLW